MFTGIIQHHAVLEDLQRSGRGAKIRIRTTDRNPFDRGESVAINGVCLTVIPLEGDLLAADLSHETLDLTTLGAIAAGTRLNVERALAVGDRLGGHFVQGHVDTVATLLSREDEGEFAVCRWSFPPRFADLVVSKGSIAVDGVSLTVVEPEQGTFGAALIPETLRRTTLGEAKAGDRMNLEFDMLAKHIRALAGPYVSHGEGDR